ncbi:MAG: sugar phosphate isomerase/epimerase family protein [Acidimicrobiales bacterium]
MDVNLAAADADMRELSTRRYAEAIEAAGELAAPRVVVCAGKRHPLIPAPVERARAWSVAALQRLVARADSAGVGLCLENLPYGLCETVAELRGLAEEVDDRVEVMVDTANAHMVEPVAAAFAAHPRVGYVHVSDTTRAAWRHDELGAGEVDVATVADALARTGATAVLELVAADPLAALERSRALLRAHGVGTAATSTNQMTNQT